MYDWLLRFALLMALAATSVDCECRENRRVEEKAVESKLSLVVYLDNANCTCDLQRTGFQLNEGSWISEPPEEIVLGECVVFGSQSYAGHEKSVKGKVRYECDQMALAVNWDKSEADNPISVVYFPEKNFVTHQELKGDHNTVLRMKIENCAS